MTNQTLTDMAFTNYAARAAVSSIADGDVNPTTEVITQAAHGFNNGEYVVYDQGTSGNWSTFTNGDRRWLHVIDIDTFSVHTTRANALSDTSRVNLATITAGVAHEFAPVSYALEITSSGETTLSGVTFDASGTADIENVSGGLIEIIISGGGDTPTIANTSGTSTVSNPVTTLVNVKDNAGANLINTRVFLEASDGTGDFPFQASVTIVSTVTTATVTHTSHPYVTGDIAVIRGADQQLYNGAYVVTDTGANTYTYTMTGDPVDTATGTITSTGAILDGLTDASGNISAARTFSLAQPITGRARKSTASPRFKTFNLNGTISTTLGLTINIQMILDE